MGGEELRGGSTRSLVLAFAVVLTAASLFAVGVAPPGCVFPWACPQRRSTRRHREESLWLRGTAGRVALDSPCRGIPSLGSWRVRCDGSGENNTVAVLEFAAAIDVVAIRCEGADCGGEVYPRFRHGASTHGPDRVRVVVDLDASARRRAQHIAPWNPRRFDAFIDVAMRPGNFTGRPSMCFLTIGDWGNQTTNSSLVAKAMGARAEKNPAVRFIVSTGDNFYPAGVSGPEDPQFRRVFEKPFGAAALQQTLWLVSAGNHDQAGINGQLAYSVTQAGVVRRMNTSSRGATMPTTMPFSERWYFPNASYSIRMPVSPTMDATFVVLDAFATDADRDSPRFLRSAFAAEDDSSSMRLPTWRFVVNHAPMFSGGFHGRRKETVEMRLRLAQPVEETNVHAFFAGHDHALEVHRPSNKTNVTHFLSGGGGGSLVTPAARLPTTEYFDPQSVQGYMEHCLLFSDAGQQPLLRTRVFRIDDRVQLSDPQGTVVYETTTHFKPHPGRG